jgi:nucleotide-binding universal stress UspA family protein
MCRKLALCVIASSLLISAAELRVPVSVNAEAELSAADFKATVERAGSAPIVKVRTPKDDLLLILVTDMVGDLALAGPAKSALAAAFQELPDRIHVTILRAQDGLRVVIDPTSDRDALEEALTALPINGKAGLLDTVEMAAQLADSVAAKSGVRVAVLYVTDSQISNYREDFTNPVINSSDSRDLSRRFPEGLIRERISRMNSSLARYQTPIFIVHLLHSRERLDEAYQNGLLQIATLTGGVAQFCRSAAEIPDAIAQAARAIASQYRVHVQLPPKASHTVSLTLSSGDRPLTYRTRFLVR